MPQSAHISRVATGFFLVACMFHTGCVTLPLLPGKAEIAATEAVHRIDAIWENSVYVAPDSVNGGKPLPGVAGRLYCFGSEVGPNKGVPLRVRGELTVDLYDTAQVAKGGAPVLLERWVIDPDTLDRLARKDLLGWGYNLFLPWSSYKPETRHIMLQAKFAPEKGTPLFTPQTSVNLLAPEHAPTLRQQTIRPVVRNNDPPAAQQPMQVERVPWAR